jgi:hypothetical protein
MFLVGGRVVGERGSGRALGGRGVSGSAVRRIGLIWLVCVVACCSVSVEGAFGAVTHELLAGLSASFSAGVPVGCGAGGANPLCISGALTGADAITVDGHSVWVADAGVSGSSRVDRFNDETGAFVGPQLDAEGAARGLGEALGVGHAFGSEQVYVNAAGGVVAVFDGATGKLAGTWNGAHTKNGPFTGPQSELKGMAVDDSVSGLDVAKGDVYVATRTAGPSEFNVVDVYSPKKAEEEGLKAGEEPTSPVAELTGTCENENLGEVVTGATPCAGSPTSVIVPFKVPLRVAVSPLNGDVLVEDGVIENNRPHVNKVDVFEPVSGMPGVYSFLFTLKGTPTGPGNENVPFEQLDEMAVDGGTGEIYLVDNGDGVVDEFAAGGEYLGRITGTPSGRFPEAAGIGVDDVTHNVLVGNGRGSPSLAVFGGDIVIPDVVVSKTEPAEIQATRVTLNGTVKLDKAGPAECYFEYGTSRSYGQKGSCQPKTVTEAEPEPAPVKRTITGLRPDTTYFYRVSATNALGGVKHTNTGKGSEDEGEVTTTGPGLQGESASEVASTAASLDATIDPNGLPTYYYFEYVEAAHYEAAGEDPYAAGHTTPTEALGSAPGELTVSQPAQSLPPSTTYHYRLVVVSEPAAGVTEEFTEPDETFTTQPPGSGFSLPDGRRWELVSPPDKHGAKLSGLFEGVIQAASSGDAFTYIASNPTEEDAPGNLTAVQILSTRGATGWESRDISLPHAPPGTLPVGQGEEYKFFSDDLSLGIAQPFGYFTSLKPDVFPLDSERTPYLRHNLTCSATPTTCYEPLVTGAPGYADVPEGTVFGGTGEAGEGTVRSVAATADLAHVIVQSGAPLKAGAPGGALYEFSAGKPFGEEELQLVSVLPAGEGGEPVGLSNVGGPGEEGINASGAVSGDGSRVVWSVKNGGLYLTDMTDGRSVRLDAAEPGTPPVSGENPVSPFFQFADSTDSRVFFTDKQQLLAGAGADDLYECEVVAEAAGPSCTLHDVAVGAGVLGGVLGSSVDGSYIYFASNAIVGDGGPSGAVPGDCRDNKATAAESCSLYVVRYDPVAHAWEAPSFIATLSGSDYPDWRPASAWRTARVSPNGGWLAFMSDRSLTGYDNHDAVSGKLDEEVFLYRARSGSQPPVLVCASCDPTGARPAGVEVRNSSRSERLITNEEIWEPSAWLAGNIPNWPQLRIEVARHQPRYLSDEGRLFFNSSDALVAQDVNKQEDVYEFEPAGVGGSAGCTSVGSTYSPATGGCVGLISSGTSPVGSAFLDASESGDDVFFLTAEKLVPQDVDTSYDVYDAHVCGAEGVPCTQGVVSPAECTTADACRAAPAPVPGVFGAPASATFSGPGNLAPVFAPKIETRAQKLTRALEQCHKDRARKKRIKCEAAAKKRYGLAKRASAKKSSHRKGSK